MLDKIVSAGINATQKTLDKEPDKEVESGFGKKTVRFVVSLIWGIVTFVVSLAAFLSMMAHVALDGLNEIFGIEVSEEFGIFAVVICLIMSAVTFIVPYLRKKGTYTRWCGIMLLCDGLWWLYIVLAQ